MQFPQYRKLPGFRRYYKIVDEKNFFESYILNGQKLTNHIVAHQFPEMLRIKDMLDMEFGYIEMDDAEVREYFGLARPKD